MQLALEQAQLAASLDEVPVGAVLVSAQQELIAAGHNQPISRHDPTAHAEIIVLRAAAAKIENYRLVDTTLYVTLEPCVMCAGAIAQARISRLVFGAWDDKAGGAGRKHDLVRDRSLPHRVAEVIGGISEAQCRALLADFFAEK